MSELYRKSFIDIWRPSQYDIDHIVMSGDECICERCREIGSYVGHIGTNSECSYQREGD